MSTENTSSDSGPVLGTLVANHRRFLDFVARRVGNRDDAEDILQAAFVRSVHKASDIRDDESAVAWFYRVLRNAITDHYRHKAAGERAHVHLANEMRQGDSVVDAELERTVCECISELIPNLKPEYADLIRRVDLGGEEIGSIANDLGLNAGNARVRLHRARAALREEVEQSCRTCATHGCLDCTCTSSKGSHL